MTRLTRTSKIAAILTLNVFAQFGLITARADDMAGDSALESSYVDAKVVEVSDTRIAVIAKSGVEHVIAIDGKKTKIFYEGRAVLTNEIKAGDVVTVELDVNNPMKVARSIEMASVLGNQLAKNRR